MKKRLFSPGRPPDETDPDDLDYDDERWIGDGGVYSAPPRPGSGEYFSKVLIFLLLAFLGWQETTEPPPPPVWKPANHIRDEFPTGGDTPPGGRTPPPRFEEDDEW